MNRIFFAIHYPCKSDGRVLSRRGRKASRVGLGFFTLLQLCQVMSLPNLWKNVEESSVNKNNALPAAVYIFFMLT